MKHKSDAFQTFQIFFNEIESQFEKKKRFRSDKGGECKSTEFNKFAQSLSTYYP